MSNCDGPPIQDVYSPSGDDIQTWAHSGRLAEQDWDIFMAEPEHLPLLVSLIEDPSCLARDTLLLSLYCTIGHTDHTDPRIAAAVDAAEKLNGSVGHDVGPPRPACSRSSRRFRRRGLVWSRVLCRTTSRNRRSDRPRSSRRTDRVVGSALRRRQLREPGGRVTINHCCQRLRDAVEFRCHEHPEVGACGDYVIGHSEKFDEYGIWVHDGPGGSASSSIEIRHCPFCGGRMSPSRRDEWFDRLEALGVEPDHAPPDMRSSAWWLGEGETARDGIP